MARRSIIVSIPPRTTLLEAAGAEGGDGRDVEGGVVTEAGVQGRRVECDGAIVPIDCQGLVVCEKAGLCELSHRRTHVGASGVDGTLRIWALS